MADQTSSWALKLEDQVSGSAETAAQALEKLEEQIGKDTKQLGAMQKAMKNLQGGTTVNVDAYRKLNAQILAQKNAIAQAQQQFLELGGAIKAPASSTGALFSRLKELVDKQQELKPGAGIQAIEGNMKDLESAIKEVQKAQEALQPEMLAEKLQKLMAASDKGPENLKAIEGALRDLQKAQENLKPPDGLKELRDSFEKLSAQAQQLPGPLGDIAGSISKLKGMLQGGAIALGVAAIATALLALVAATAVAIRKLYEYGTAQADARRSELLRLEGLTKLRFMYQKQAGNAKEMQAALDRVAASTPTARGQLAKYGDELYRAGLRGKAWETTLEAMSIKHAVQGEAAAHSFAGWAAGANMAGKSVDKLADSVKARLGGIAQKQMSSLTVQAEKQKEAMDALFGDLNIDSWLDAWKEVKDLMSQSTASGRALKALLTAFLQPMIDSSTKAASVLKVFFQNLIILALRFGITILKIRNWFKDTFGDAGVKTAVAALVGLFAALFVVVTILMVKGLILLTPMLLSAATAMWGMATAVWATLAPFLPFILAIAAVAFFVYQLIQYWDELKQAFSDLDWVQAGKDLVMGLLKGMMWGPKLIGEAVAGLGSLAINALKKAIGAESPAKAFIKVGTTIPQGVAVGVDEEAGVAQDATERMLDAASTTPRLDGAIESAAGGEGAAGGGAAVGGRGGGNTITIGEITVNAQSSDPKQLALDFRRELESVLESLAFEVGAEVPA